MGAVVLVAQLGAILGAPIGGMLTNEMAQALKRQINDLMDYFRLDIDKLRSLQQLLAQLDLQQVYDVMKNVNENMSKNFMTFITSQQERINMIKNLRIQQLSNDPLMNIFGHLMQLLSVIGAGLMAIEVVLATNPATIAVSAIMYALTQVFSIINIVGNIIAINDLEKKQQELRAYFKPGGEFQRAQQQLKQSAVQLTKHFYLLILNGRNLVKTISARIMLIQLEGQSEFDYGKFIEVLQRGYFDLELEQKVFFTYTKLFQVNEDNNLSLGNQITRMYAILENMMKQDIFNRLRYFRVVLSIFTEEKPISKRMDKEYEYMSMLHQNRLRFAKLFEMRNHKNQQNLPAYDQSLLEKMNYDQNFVKETPEDKKKLQIASLTSFFTTTFFGDSNDKSGNTIYGYNLRQMQQKTRLLEYVDAFSMSNAFLIPKPVHSEELTDWTMKINKLISEFMKQYKGEDQPFVQFLYMRIQNHNKIVAGQQTVVLNMFYGIVLKIRGEIKTFDMPVEKLTKNNPYSNEIEDKIEKIDTLENIVKNVVNPLQISGFEYVVDGKISEALIVLLQAAKTIQTLPEKWRHFKVGDLTIEGQAKNFKGLSINLRQIKYEETRIYFHKDLTYPLTTKSFISQNLHFICHQIMLFNLGQCKPWRMESINITKKDGKYEALVEYSDSPSHGNFLGKTLHQIILAGVHELQEFATKLRAQKKQLFIITVTAFEEIICWYME